MGIKLDPKSEHEFTHNNNQNSKHIKAKSIMIHIEAQLH